MAELAHVEDRLPQPQRIEFDYQGPPGVLELFARNAKLRQLGLPLEGDTWLILPGGGTKGALQAGMMQAAVDSGIFYGAKKAAAMSVGAAVLVGGAAKNKNASKIFYEDNLHNKFISFHPLDIIRGRMVNFQGLEWSFREHYPLDREELRRCPVEVFVGVMPNEGSQAGKVVFHDARHHPDPIGLTMASMLLPRVGNIPSIPLEVDGEVIHHNDGGMVDPYAINYAIENGARNILFFMNEKYDPDAFRRVVARVKYELGKRDKHPTRRAALQSEQRSIEGIDKLKMNNGVIVLEDGSEVRIAMIAPTQNRVKFLERNWQLLRRAVGDSEEAGHRMFDDIMQQPLLIPQQEYLAATA